MLSLVLAGKLSISEDVLTAAVLGTFRIFHEPELLRGILRTASRRHVRFEPPSYDRYEIELWPSHRAGEPDGRLVLYDRSRAVARVLIEAKLGAQKSGVGDLSEDPVSGDQLARYLVAESEDFKDCPVVLVYLTQHGCTPADDMRSSETALVNAGRADLLDHLFWMSWRDVERALPTDRGQAWSDVKQVMRRVWMFRFGGMRRERLGAREGHWTYQAGESKTRRYPESSRIEFASPTPWTYSRLRRAQAYEWRTQASIDSRPDFYAGAIEHGR